MHVLFDHQAFSRQSHGGVSRYYVELARALNNIEPCSASIFAPIHWNDYLQEPENQGFSSGIHQRKGIFRFWNQRWWTNHIMTSMRCQVCPPTILHETWYSTRAYPLRVGTKLVTTVHDLIYQKHPEWTRDSADRSLQLAASVDRADIVFCDSIHTREDLLQWRPALPEEKVHVVYLGVSNLEKNPSSKAVRTVLPRVSCPFMLYVGQRAAPNKNFHNLARAFFQSTLHKNFTLLCFGGGAFSYDEVQFFREIGFAENQVVQISGNDSMLAQAYQSASAFIYPSIYEGFGLPPLEAMQYGCPVACSSATCLPEIGGNACLYFDPHDESDIAHALQQIIQDSTMRSNLIIKGFERVKQFTWKNAAEKALAVYESVA